MAYPCDDKQRFTTEAEARSAIVYSDWRRGQETKLTTYRCKYCNDYHITTDYSTDKDEG
jgi:hypothetical protein